ncbi:hypothetical protein JCGZ_00653 [Jatropha curcas]|uniref:DUF7356 domain-containing protein n=1 Tax=Jatropha curcas TaxID=180498 RepID=A0A067JDD1_JATCU|nr:uncharacterized protein LOC105649104 [Jatropha curcas]KDP21866.1 hypothetical protein JCGZ_00653 [Jatropha curcas]
MDRNGIVAVFVLVLIVADVSNASLLSAFQRFVTLASTGSSDANQVSPSPSPDPLQTGTKTTTSNETNSKGPKVPDNSNNVNNTSKVSRDTGMVNPPPQNEGGIGKTYETMNKNEGKMDSQSEGGLNCTGLSRRCKDRNSLVACILNYEDGHNKLVVLVQNEGKSFLKVDLSAPNPIDNALIEIPKYETKKISLSAGYSSEVILKAGHGECILHTDLPVSRGNFFFHLPSYENIITPINGAYFLILTVILIGGLWAWCLFRKRSRQDGIPYQELEMSLPESAVANNEAEGWDQGWDDDWDEENAVKSPAARHSGSISANGLTSRSLKKDGWENDWDD